MLLRPVGSWFHCLIAVNAKEWGESERYLGREKLRLLPRVLCECTELIDLKLGKR